MPELPEVEFARGLAHRECHGKRITEVIAQDDAKVFCNKTPAELSAAMEGRSVTAVVRKGKYFWFLLSGEGPAVLFHFGMAGHLAVKGVDCAKYVRLLQKDGAPQWPPRFTKMQILFNDGTAVAFCDSRRFARVKIQDDPTLELPVSKLGPDAHLALPDLEAFTALMARHRRAIKAVLLDQAVFAGIGNWVGDEVLYQARLFPERPCRELDADEVARLHAAIRDVITLAVDVGADHHRFPAHWIFHFRWTGKTATKDFHGNAIDFITVGGRTTAYVPTLQKLSAAGCAALAEKALAAAEATATEVGTPGVADAVVGVAKKAPKKRAAPKKRSAAAAIAGAGGDDDAPGDDAAPSKKAAGKPAAKGRKRKAAAAAADDEPGTPAVDGGAEAAAARSTSGCKAGKSAKQKADGFLATATCRSWKFEPPADDAEANVPEPVAAKAEGACNARARASVKAPVTPESVAAVAAPTSGRQLRSRTRSTGEGAGK